MQSDFVKVICQMGIFMICAQAIIHFRPKAAYEKYLKMLVSVMMVMQMFLFVGEVFSSDAEQLFKESAGWLREQLETNSLFAEEEWQIIGEEPMQETGAQIGTVTVPEITVQVAPIEEIHIGIIQ